MLVIDGPTAPAPLARLLSPGVFTLQTSNSEELEIPAGWQGPAVLALVPEGAAQFRHLPSGSGFSGLEVVSLPDAAMTVPHSNTSTSQQSEDLALLKLLAASTEPTSGESTLAARAPTPAPAEDVSADAEHQTDQPIDPVDALASWLLANADLEGL